MTPSLALRVGVVSGLLVLALPGVVSLAQAQAANAPSVKTALGLKPLQADVDYDVPDTKTIEQCKVTANTTNPFACPEGCLFFEPRKVSDQGWVRDPKQGDGS